MRLSVLIAALVCATPAVAGNYVAQPVDSTQAGKIVVRDMVWNCAAGTCRGSTSESRPAIQCQAFAKKAGRLNGFAVDGRAFAAAELERCNAAAPAAKGEAVAEAR